MARHRVRVTPGQTNTRADGQGLPWTERYQEGPWARRSRTWTQGLAGRQAGGQVEKGLAQGRDSTGTDTEMGRAGTGTDIENRRWHGENHTQRTAELG